MNNEKALLVASIRNRLFASRDTVDQALNYAVSAIERLVVSDDRAAIYTALHVVMNTIADKIEGLPDAAQLPEPPAEVRIAHADLPDTGAVDLDTRIAEIADERIRRLNIQRQIERTIEEWSEDAAFGQIVEEWFNENVDIEDSITQYIDDKLEDHVRNVLCGLDLRVRITD